MKIEFAVLKNQLGRDGICTCKVVTDSMEPLIRVNEVIQVLPIRDFEQLKRFDILVFLNNNLITCHFLWNKKSHGHRQIITRSLKNPWVNDPNTPEFEVAGIVAEKRVNNFIRLKLILGEFLRKFLGVNFGSFHLNL